MAKMTVTGRDWLAFEDWASEELNLFDFRVKFMTDEERAEQLGPRDVSERLIVVKGGKMALLDLSSGPEPEMSDEEWKQMRDDIDTEDQRDKAELVAVA